MKKYIKFVVLFLIILLFPLKQGFSESWNDIKKDVNDLLGDDLFFRCEYTGNGLEFSNFRLTFKKDEVDEEYDKNAISHFASSSIGYQEFGSYHIIVSNFSLKSFLNYYKTNNKKCPTFVYFCNSVGDETGVNLDLLNAASDSTFNHSCYKFTSTTANAEDMAPNGCHNENAKSCKVYSKPVFGKTLYIELGKLNSNRNYIQLSYDSNFTQSAVSPDMPGAPQATLINGDTALVMDGDNGKNFFDYVNCNDDSCTYPDDIQLVHSCFGDKDGNYKYYIFDSTATYNNVNFGGYQVTTGECISIDDPTPSTPSTPSTNPDISDIGECTSLLGDPNTEGHPAFYLNKAFTIVKYVAIILLVVLSMFDFISAATSGDEKALKNALNKTIKRAILCIAIYLLPMIISFVLKYLNDRAADLCGIGGGR